MASWLSDLSQRGIPLPWSWAKKATVTSRIRTKNGFPEVNTVTTGSLLNLLIAFSKRIPKWVSFGASNGGV